MNKKIVVMAIAAGLTLTSSVVVQASTKKVSVKPIIPTAKSTYFKGVASKGATIKLSRYKTVYAYGKVTNKGNYSLKLKHKIHAGWKYRVTAAKKGYKTTKKYIKVVTTKKTMPNTTVNVVSTTSSTPTAKIVTQPNSSSITNTNVANTPKVTNAPNSAVSPQQKSDIALADQYQAKADELIKERDALYKQINPLEAQHDLYMVYRPKSAEYYADLNSKINSYQQQMTSLLASNSGNQTDINYQELQYHLTQLENEKSQSQQKDSEFAKLPADYDDDNVSKELHTAYAKTSDLFDESHHFHQLAHQLYTKYGLDTDPDWDSYYLQ